MGRSSTQSRSFPLFPSLSKHHPQEFNWLCYATMNFISPNGNESQYKERFNDNLICLGRWRGCLESEPSEVLAAPFVCAPNDLLKFNSSCILQVSSFEKCLNVLESLRSGCHSNELLQFVYVGTRRCRQFHVSTNHFSKAPRKKKSVKS